MGTYPGFSVLLEVSEGVALVTPAGELDLNTAPELVDKLLFAEQPSVSGIMLDLGALTFIDSTGLKVFLEASKRADANGHRLLFVSVRPEVRRVFEVTGTEYILDREDAVSLLAERQAR